MLKGVGKQKISDFYNLYYKLNAHAASKRGSTVWPLSLADNLSTSLGQKPWIARVTEYARAGSVRLVAFRYIYYLDLYMVKSLHSIIAM
ncbi:hypothetical protein C0081_17600 [Cohaesibacter celericrescens]|uniref:Uncharacterized protein n=1 Tax=Cohaesibacter celericrescens TaxID=2067669 RepID=A0A2N5XND4_9HYPH|nr:hypothetical protein C0081_17600 [Cohaesibacter celericrescens]